VVRPDCLEENLERIREDFRAENGGTSGL